MSSPYVRRLRLGKEVRALRTERNMTQARMARLAGMTRNNVSVTVGGRALSRDECGSGHSTSKTHHTWVNGSPAWRSRCLCLMASRTRPYGSPWVAPSTMLGPLRPRSLFTPLR